MRARTGVVGGLTTLLGLAAAVGAQPPGTAAVVNGEPIPLAQVEAELQCRPPSAAALTASQQRELKLAVVNGLIDVALERQFLRKNGPPIKSSEIDQGLAALQTAQVAVGKTLADYYRDTKQTEEQVRANIQHALQMERYLDARSTPAELGKYLEANREFFEKVTVHCRHIHKRVPADAPAAEREATRQRLTALRQEILDGKIEFGEAAKRYSECPSGSNGGDLGFLVRKWMPVDENILRTAFALKPGEVSEVVTSEVGLHLLQVVERTAPTPVTLEQCLPAVRESYQAELKMGILAEQRRTAGIQVLIP
jgi:peptidyl-prolyl cis-trans isomerase C